jgi:NADPH:quinone reductase
VKAVILRETGGPEQLEYADAADPELGEGQVLVRVRAAGVNFADLLVRQGRYPQPPDLPTILGREIAGEVDGRRVMTASGAETGGYAELAAASEEWLAPLPDFATFEEGAAFLTTFLTAYIPLKQLVRAGPGSTVLVHAGAGGVGSAAIQLAKHFGATVLATASSEEKRQVARELGAEEVFGYDEFAERIKADVIVDTVGGEVFKQSIGVLKPLGTIVAIGFADGWWDPLDTALIVGRNLAVQGFYLGRLMKLQPQVVQEATREVVELWEQGAVKPLVGATFALREAPQAHALIEERRSVGKVVLVP